MGLWKYSHSVALLVYLLDFGTDQRVWHYLFYYWTLELFRQCGIIVFFIFLLSFGAVATLWHYWFVYGSMELF